MWAGNIKEYIEKSILNTHTCRQRWYEYIIVEYRWALAPRPAARCGKSVQYATIPLCATMPPLWFHCVTVPGRSRSLATLNQNHQTVTAATFCPFLQWIWKRTGLSSCVKYAQNISKDNLVTISCQQSSISSDSAVAFLISLWIAVSCVAFLLLLATDLHGEDFAPSSRNSK